MPVEDDHDDGGFEALIAPLPQAARTALILRFVEDLDYDAIGAALDCSAHRRDQRVSTAIHSLRERLQP